MTINYEIDVTSAVSYENGVSRDMGQNRQEHVVKIADEGLYRKMTVYIDGSNPQVLERAFGGLDADAQRNLFFKTFLALLAEKDNFVYDSEEGVYIAPAKISVRVEGTEGAYAVETMTNGRIKIDANGNVEYFSCTLDEKSYFDNKLSTQVIGDAVWSFSDYGTTVVDSSLIGDGENHDSENEEPPVQEPDYEDPADDPAVEDPSTEDPDSNDPDVVDPENT